MIIKYLNFINESVKDLVFVPAELRTRKSKFNPWKEKKPDAKYRSKLEYIVKDRFITFHYYVYTVPNEGRLGEITMLIKKLNFNPQGLICLVGDIIGEIPRRDATEDENEFEHKTGMWSFALDETKEIVIENYEEQMKIAEEIRRKEEEKRIKHLHIDPYGEEEWE